MVSPLNRWSLPTALAVVSIAAAAALFVVDGLSAGRSVPDVRGSTPTGASHDASYPRGWVGPGAAYQRGWVRPLLDAGFCVDFRYDPSTNSFERNGHFEGFADTEGIVGEIPEQGSRLPAGSTVTVIVGGSNMNGPVIDWDQVPLVCPTDRA
jgi:hypothetical protein